MNGEHARSGTPNGPLGGDAQTSLGALEGKLRELQKALAGLSGAEEPAPPEPPLTPGGGLPVRDVVAEAEAEAMRIVEDARTRAGTLSGQIDELVDLRDGLYASARGLLDEWEGALARARGEATPAAGASGPLHGNGRGRRGSVRRPRRARRSRTRARGDRRGRPRRLPGLPPGLGDGRRRPRRAGGPRRGAPPHAALRARRRRGRGRGVDSLTVTLARSGGA